MNTESIINNPGGPISKTYSRLGKPAPSEGLIAGARSQLQKLGVMKPDPLMKEFSYTDTKAQLTQRYNNPIVQVQEYRRPLHQFGTSLTALHDVGHKLQNEMDRWGNENENWVRRMLPANKKLPPIYYHSGILATHKDGQQSFIEKGEQWGIDHNTIVKRPEGMSKDFRSYGDPIKPSSTLRIGDLIKAADQGAYDHLRKNCNHAVHDTKERARGIIRENKNKKTP